MPTIPPSTPVYTQVPVLYTVDREPSILDDQLLATVPQLVVTVNSVPIANSVSVSSGSANQWGVELVPDGMYSSISYFWDFGDSAILDAPPPIREEKLFPNTRGSYEDCEDLFSTFECAFEPKHGTGGTLSTIIPDGLDRTNLEGISYFPLSGFVTGSTKTCTLSNGILTDTTGGIDFTTIPSPTSRYVILKYYWTIGSNDLNTLSSLTGVFAPSTLYSGTPYRFHIEDSGGNRLYTNYGSVDPITMLFTDPNADWTANEYVGDNLVVLVAYQIQEVLSSTTVRLSYDIPNSSTNVWYNINPGNAAISGTGTTVGTNVITITSINPYYKTNVLQKNIITLTSVTTGVSFKRLIASNTSNTITVVNNSSLPLGTDTYTFTIDTCDNIMILASSESLYSNSMQFQSEIDPNEYVTLSDNYFAFDSGEIIKLVDATPSSVENMYTVTVSRQSLYESIYYAKDHYAGEIAVNLTTRGTRDDTQIIDRVHMKETRAIRHSDVFSTSYSSYT